MAFEIKGNPGKNTQIILDAYLSSIHREIRLICLEVERQAKQNLTDTEKVDRGFTRNSLDHEVVRTATDTEGIVFAGTLWSKWVEFGRHGAKQSPVNAGPNSATPAFPPRDAIEGWVRRNRKKLGIGRGKNSEQQIKSAAFLIARKIYEEGIDPSPFLVPAFLEAAPFFKARIVKAIANTKPQLGKP